MGSEILPDFSLLSADMIAEEVMQDLEGKERIEDEFQSQIEKLQSKLNVSIPNLKAFDQYTNIKQQETEELNKLEEAKKTEQKISRSFQELHNQRYNLFMEVRFLHVL